MNNHRTLVYLLTSLNIAHSLTAKQLYKKLETSLFPKSSSSTSSLSHINHNRSLQNNHKCLDVKDWYDSDGTYYDCQWYGEYDSRCSNHGHSYENFGYVANEACCACGGGVQQDYKVIEDGTCKSNGMLPIYDKETCIDAASALGYSIEWGPHGGYQDVVDGCSIRFGAHLFLNSQEGTCDPEHGIGGWTHTGCQCADWMPCFCEEISYQHIPNTYCEYYEQGGTEDCATGDSFVDVWEKCLEDGSDKCMGVMWNSCEGPTSDINVNGAWKLMKAGQDVGDANNPTATCGGKRQALGHWDVFLV